MRHVLFALPLLATTMAFAQAPRPFTLHHTYSLDQPNVSPLNHWSCPVGMTAEQQANGATQWVVSLEDSRDPVRIPRGKMGVRVGLTAPKDWAIREAKVVVSYMVPPAGAMLVGGSPSTETRTFELSAGEAPVLELERSLQLSPGVSVTRVKLLSLTYADGTVWQPDGAYNCSVRVSHFLPVNAAR